MAADKINNVKGGVTIGNSKMVISVEQLGQAIAETNEIMK